MNVIAYENFLSSITAMKIEDVVFLNNEKKEINIVLIKKAIAKARELEKYGEMRIALENLLDNLSEIGLFLSSEQIEFADKAFEIKNTTETILINYYLEHLCK